MKKTLLSLLLSSSGSLAFAQTDSTDTGKLSISGYLDSYYLTAFNRPKSGNLLGVDQLAGRAFDRLTDQFALGLVQVKLGYASRKTDMVVDLTFGPNAEMSNFGNTAGVMNSYRPQSPYGAALYGTSAAIKQVYFTYRATPRLSFTVGQFGTHIGYEVAEADSAAGRLVASHAFGVYDHGYVTKRLHGKVRYRLTVEVKNGRYRAQFTDFTFAYYQDDRSARPQPTGKTKPLEETAAPGWQKLWETHRHDTATTVAVLAGELKTAMLAVPRPPSLPVSRTTDW